MSAKSLDQTIQQAINLHQQVCQRQAPGLRQHVQASRLMSALLSATNVDEIEQLKQHAKTKGYDSESKEKIESFIETHEYVRSDKKTSFESDADYAGFGVSIKGGTFNGQYAAQLSPRIYKAELNGDYAGTCARVIYESDLNGSHSGENSQHIIGSTLNGDQAGRWSTEIIRSRLNGEFAGHHSGFIWGSTLNGDFSGLGSEVRYSKANGHSAGLLWSSSFSLYSMPRASAISQFAELKLSDQSS